MESKTKERVLEIVKEVLNEEVDENSSTENIGSWDSISYMAILSAIEDEYGLEINESNINNFNSVVNIVLEIENAKK